MKLKCQALMSCFLMCYVGSLMAYHQSKSEQPNNFSPIILFAEYTGVPEKSQSAWSIYDINTSVKEGIQYTPGTLFQNIVCVDSQTCVAIGHIYSQNSTTFMTYKTMDGGFNWISHNLGAFGGPSGLCSLSCKYQNCVAVGVATPIGRGEGQPIVYTSSNNGSSWKKNYPLNNPKFRATMRSISCNGLNAQHCTAIGDFPEGMATTFVSYISEDGGNNWTYQKLERHEGLHFLNSVSCNHSGKYCAAVGNLELGSPPNGSQPIIYESKNFGKDWERAILPEFVKARLLTINCNNDYCLSVGYEKGLPLILIHNENTWTKINSKNTLSCPSMPIKGLDVNFNYQNFRPTSSQLQSVTCSKDETSCMASGHGNFSIHLKNNKIIKVQLPVFYRTNDSGEHWQQECLDYSSRFTPAILRELNILTANKE